MIAGIVFAGIWLVLAESVQRGMTYLNNELVSDPIYAKYLKSVRRIRALSGRWILNVYLPSLVALVWVLLMWFVLKNRKG